MEIFQQITESLTTAVLLFDEKLHLSFLNPAGEHLLGTSVRSANKLRADELFADQTYLIALQACLLEDKGFIQKDVSMRLPNQETINVNSTATPLMNPAATSNNCLMLELINAPSNRRQVEQKLQVQFDTTKAIVRGMAHEIKNPLGGLRGAAQLLEKELHTEELKEYTQIIIGEADRLQNLLDRMLSPNRMPVKKQINIHRVVEHVRNLVIADAYTNVEIKRDYDPSIPELEIDEDQLIQALLNLVRNAAQAVESKDGGCIKLKTRTERQCTIGSTCHKLAARIDVIDNGPGIPENIREQIFYPMVTGRAEGTGLGLSVAQSLINHHGGSLQCLSQPKATVFTILLPLESVNDE